MLEISMYTKCTNYNGKYTHFILFLKIMCNFVHNVISFLGIEVTYMNYVANSFEFTKKMVENLESWNLFHWGQLFHFDYYLPLKTTVFQLSTTYKMVKNKIIKSQTKVLLPLLASINALKGVTTTKRYIQHIKGSQTFQRKNSLVLRLAISFVFPESSKTSMASMASSDWNTHKQRKASYSQSLP